jgi:lipid-A-disaccharide synthase
MISCGEASGDLYAGALTRALRDRDPGIEVFGFGGAGLAGAGGALLGDYRGFAVTGLVEALAVVPRSWRMLGTLAAAASARRPDVFVAIDFPDFNFRLMRRMHRLGIPVVYYVSPQLWAWRAGRLATIRRHVRKMLVIFPFEAELYERAGVPVEFVGHPLVDLAVAGRSRAEVASEAGLDPARPIVALLPGSRPNEVARLLPGLADAARRVARDAPAVQFLLARAPALDDVLFAPLAALRDAGVAVGVVEHAADDVLAAADVVITASGTATVQTALHGKPMVIVYRLSRLTYALGRRVVRVGTYGMVNLVAGRPIVPELIQDRFTPDAVARETIALLTDEARANTMRDDLADVRARLGGAGASGRAADAILRV